MELNKELAKNKDLAKGLRYTLSLVEQLVLDPKADAKNWPHLLYAPSTITSQGPPSEPVPDEVAADPDDEPNEDLALVGPGGDEELSELDASALVEAQSSTEDELARVA